MKFLLLFAALPLFGASLVIDAGSDSDTECPTGYKYTVNPAADTTLCFGNPVYRIPVDDSVPYVVKFNFLEPSSLPPARAFSVSINDVAVLPRVTTPEYLHPFSRTVGNVFGADGFLVIRFTTINRSAVISSIEVTPLFQLFAVEPGFQLVQEQCARCHGNDVRPGDVAGVGGLDLRTRTSMLSGGGRGPAIVPGDPEHSLAYRFASRPGFPTATPEQTLAQITSDDNTLGMPPLQPLPADSIETIRDWIARGAYRLKQK